ncbi:hypothetical protein HYU14_06045 [Candidatus Woesearchaeota archaeon]|nr:hypothetical protein [Candidatus Woesearchaeota archaeon]
MVESISEIDPERFKNFVRHICVVAKRHEDREESRMNLSRQVLAIRSAHHAQGNMDREIEKLYHRIDDVLRNESRLWGRRGTEGSVVQEVSQKMKELRFFVDELHEGLDSLKDKIGAMQGQPPAVSSSHPSTGQEIILVQPPSQIQEKNPLPKINSGIESQKMATLRQQLQARLGSLEKRLSSLRRSRKITNGIHLDEKISFLKGRLAYLK